MEAAFETSLLGPPALHAAIDAVLARKLAAYGYVLSLVAIGARDEAGVLFLEFLARRLALPTNVVRSANRRYRR